MAYTAVTNRLANERVRVEPLLLSQRRWLEMIVRGVSPWRHHHRHLRGHRTGPGHRGGCRGNDQHRHQVAWVHWTPNL
jgi:hypothetical protein